VQRFFSFFLISIFLIIGITACGSGTCSSSSTSNQIKLGILPNGSEVYLSSNNLPVTESTPQQTTIYLVGGSSNESFTLNFTSSQLPSVNVVSAHKVADSNGISVTPNPCFIGTVGSGLANSCTVEISVSNSTYPGIYNVTPTAVSTGGVSTVLSPITVLVSGSIKPSSKAITFFSLSGTTGVITGSNISVTMPYGTDVSSLIATYITTGSSVTVDGITQNNGVTTNNFSSPVIYTVIAADGSTQNYTVNVTVAPNSAESITAFSLNGTAGVISETNITVTMPYGTDVTALIATFTTTGESVTVGVTPQISAVTPNNFTNPVTYTVHAANGSTQNYLVNVTVASNSAESITAFSLNGTVGVISGTNIAVIMPYGTDVTALIATFTTTGESVTVGVTPQISAVTPNNFTNPVTYTVHAANGSTQNYLVTATVASAKWAYFPNSGAGALGAYTLCSVSSTDGSLTNCNTQDPVGGGLTAPHGMAIKNNYAYFAGFNDNSYTKCSIDASNGILSNCSSVTPATPGALNGPYSLAINGNYAYFPNSGDNSYTQCLISTSDGRLSGCNSSLLSGLNSPLALAFNNGYAYFTNFSYPAGSYTQCNVSSSDGSLSGCNTVTPAAPGDLSMPFAVAFNSGYAYFANFSSYYTQCGVSSSDGTLSGCNGVVPLAPGALNNPVGVAFNGDYAYFTNLTGNSYTQCSVNPSDGSLSGCNTVIPSGVGALSSPYGVAFH